MKSSPSIWHYVVSVKYTVKILSIFVTFLENTNFKIAMNFWEKYAISFLGQCNSSRINKSGKILHHKFSQYDCKLI